ncbi:MAG: PTS sugar transporter subunit IIA [Elusimicrobiota bacterium]
MAKVLANNDILTTQELSKYLKLNEKTVLKLAQTGKIPGFKIGNQWRFYLSTVDEYLQDNIIKTSAYNIGEMITTTDIMPLSRLTDNSLINLNLKSIGHEDVLMELSNIAFEAGIADTAHHLEMKLLEREKMLSTAIGKGIAMPHPRNPNEELFRRPCVVIARSIQGVYFKAPDGNKVHMFFMPCATNVMMHLKLLSKIAKLLTAKYILQRFMKVKSKQELIKLLLENERINSEVK